LTGGGNDTATGGGGNDTFNLGATLAAADRINGGASDNINMPTLRYSIQSIEVSEHKG